MPSRRTALSGLAALAILLSVWFLSAHGPETRRAHAPATRRPPQPAGAAAAGTAREEAVPRRPVARVAAPPAKEQPFAPTRVLPRLPDTEQMRAYFDGTKLNGWVAYDWKLRLYAH